MYLVRFTIVCKGISFQDCLHKKPSSIEIILMINMASGPPAIPKRHVLFNIVRVETSVEEDSFSSNVNITACADAWYIEPTEVFLSFFLSPFFDIPR